MRPKHANGRWLDPFVPFDASWESGFVEANAWQYTWFVPHDVYGLIDLMGGEAAFSENLETLFRLEAKTDETTPPDVSGLIGQYAHGNEPSHHIPFLFSYVKQPYRTQELVRQIMATMYSDREDGLVGNEDCGQMSAWYVLNAMGFYSFLPGSDQYLVGSPIFRRVIIEVAEGRQFVIEAPQASEGQRYVQSAAMDGQPYGKVYFRHQDIVAGKRLTFQMGDQPSPTWGKTDESLPPRQD
jgi:predicted alpha-1,2-mannosidase